MSEYTAIETKLIETVEEKYPQIKTAVEESLKHPIVESLIFNPDSYTTGSNGRAYEIVGMIVQYIRLKGNFKNIIIIGRTPEGGESK